MGMTFKRMSLGLKIICLLLLLSPIPLLLLLTTNTVFLNLPEEIKLDAKIWGVVLPEWDVDSVAEFDAHWRDESAVMIGYWPLFVQPLLLGLMLLFFLNRLTWVVLLLYFAWAVASPLIWWSDQDVTAIPLILIYLACFIYLLMPKVKEQFK